MKNTGMKEMNIGTNSINKQMKKEKKERKIIKTKK